MHPPERTASHQAQQESLGRDPAGKLPEPGDVAQGHASLLQFEMPQVFQHDIGHGHAQSGREILLGHSLLPCRVGKKSNQAIGQIAGVAGLVELNRHPFAVGHLAKILQVRAHNRNSVRAGQVRHTAASRGGGVRHHGNG